MSYSRTDLRTEVAENLGLLAVGQTLTAADAAKIDKAIVAAVEYLMTENVVIFDASGTDTDADIPKSLFHALAEYVETYAASAFGKPRDAGLREDALRRIRRVALRGKSNGPARAAYF